MVAWKKQKNQQCCHLPCWTPSPTEYGESPSILAISALCFLPHSLTLLRSTLGCSSSFFFVPGHPMEDAHVRGRMVANDQLEKTEKPNIDINLICLQTELRSCAACGEPISDRYLLEVGGCTWHGSCLRCCVCLSPLDRQPSCFLRERQVYCKADYTK